MPGFGVLRLRLGFLSAVLALPEVRGLGFEKLVWDVYQPEACLRPFGD